MPNSYSYTYESLHPAERQVRLLTLLPDVPGTEIHCRLEIVSLNNSPQYEALSYVWGESLILRTVFIKGKESLVTTNLEAALQHLRHAEKKRVLWIDALCINQKSNEEKSWQIQLMGDIYRNASSVIVWLGKKDFEIDRAFDVLDNFVKGKFWIENATEREWSGLEKIFQHAEWWTRLWVVQELIFARSVVLQCGDRICLWEPMMTKLLPVLMPGSLVGALPKDRRLSRVFKKPQSMFLIQLADRFRTSSIPKQLNRLENFIETLSTKRNYTDPRDTIYALLGLVNLSNPPEIIPDYRKSISQVFLEFTKQMLVLDNRLTLLCNTYYDDTDHEDRARNKRTPSWSIDWSKSRRVESLINYYPPNSKVFYEADSGILISNEIFHKDIPVLKLEGILLDDIASISTSFQDLKGWQAVVRKWETMKSSTKVKHQANEDILDVYLRTLLRDVDRHGFGMPKCRLSPEAFQKYQVHFRYWMDHPEHDDEFDEEWRPNPDIDNNTRKEFEFFLACSLINWCLFITKKGYMGLVENNAIIGDEIWIVDGACTPLILRNASLAEAGEIEDTINLQRTKTLSKVSAAYVHGIMDGEFMSMIEKKELVKNSIFLV